MKTTLQAVDWSQLWYPGPSRRFSKEELQRAGDHAPSATFWMVALVNAVATCVGPLAVAPADWRVPLALAFVAVIAVAAAMVQSLWRHPSRRRLMAFMLAWGAVGLALAVGVKRLELLSPEQSVWLFNGIPAVVTAVTVGLWMLSLYRAHQIEARLKELAERDEAVRLAHRLSAAQLQPHFLFNTLASIQHWVDTGDARAGGTLRSLTGYLRALLPMFEQPLHPLADELAAMQRYLEVMQARLGPKLRWRFEGAAPAAAMLPPGLGLTLLENAVEHGVQASLHGAEVLVRCTHDAAMIGLEVLDTGPGLALPQVDGVGLRNCRQRLQQAFGSPAAIELNTRRDGPGCAARVTWPLHPTSNTA
ncbi:sensor histidine kinase [Ideonella sp. BN130291]|uniref:sensor histidine kinase n=1 Tax=Ideonella sp. BN130291 TaxID=3112940 RepID=UPI002E26A392|nr:histidine kinase [Ideonella sp. BN130291]